VSKASELAQVFLEDYVGKDCPPSREKMDELRDAISVLVHMVYDLDTRAVAAEENLEAVRRHLARVEDSLPNTPLGSIAVIDDAAMTD
jgi:hypothetical protein